MIQVYPALVLAFLLWLLRRQAQDRHPQPLDLGVTFLLVVGIYGLMPSLGFLLAWHGHGEIRDARVSGVDVDLVEAVQWMHLSFCSTFALAYFYRRKAVSLARLNAPPSASTVGRLAFVSALALAAAPLTLAILGAGGADSYADSYARILALPLLQQQLLGVTNQISMALMVASIVFAIAHRPRLHGWVLALILGGALYSTFAGGSRTFAFLAILAYASSASFYVRGFGLGALLRLLVPGLLLFLIAGLLRAQSSDSFTFGALQDSEFVALFVNAMDLKVRFENEVPAEIRAALYGVDLLRLIPSQLLDGQKLDPAAWYVQTFYPEYFDSGGGLAFGTLAEAAAGAGAWEAAVRGALLGLIFSALHNLLLRRSTIKPLQVFLYVWLIVQCYQAYRDTTFSMLGRALNQLPVTLLLLMALQDRPITAASPRHGRFARARNPSV